MRAGTGTGVAAGASGTPHPWGRPAAAGDGYLCFTRGWRFSGVPEPGRAEIIMSMLPVGTPDVLLATDFAPAPAVYWDRGEVIYGVGENHMVSSCIETGELRWIVRFDPTSYRPWIVGLEGGETILVSNPQLYRVSSEGEVLASHVVAPTPPLFAHRLVLGYHPRCGLLVSTTEALSWWSTETLTPVEDAPWGLTHAGLGASCDTMWMATNETRMELVSTTGLVANVDGYLISATDDGGALMRGTDGSLLLMNSAGEEVSTIPWPEGIGGTPQRLLSLGENGVLYALLEGWLSGRYGVAAIYVGVSPGVDLVTRNSGHTNSPLTIEVREIPAVE